MANATNLQQSLNEFEKGRMQLANVSMQKQQLQMQSDSLFSTLEELQNTKEEKVYKFAGSILVLAPVNEVLKDVETKKESVDLRLKSMLKQESILIDKMNKLREEIEKSQGAQKTGSSKAKDEDESD